MDEMDAYMRAFGDICKVLLALIIGWGLFSRLADVNWPFLLDELQHLIDPLRLEIETNMESLMKPLSMVGVVLLIFLPIILASLAELFGARKRKDKPEKKR